MRPIRAILILLAFALCAKAASFRSQNFQVEAPTQEFAQRVAQVAEAARKQQAIEWLGYELPSWTRPCPLKATVAASGSGGATNFAFDQGKLLSMECHVEGTATRILDSVVPHECCHMVLASYFQAPLPRCIDEGGAVCSECLDELARHDQMCRQILNTPGRKIPLARLFALKEYPSDFMALYAEGYSVTRFLIERKGKKALTGCITYAMSRGWDEALRTTYDIEGVNGLEGEWLASLKASKGQAIRPLGETAPIKTGGSPVAATLAPSAPTTPVAMAPQNEVPILNRIEAKLDALLPDVADLKKRVEALERGQKTVPVAASQGTIRDIPGWNQNRQPPAQPYAAPAGPYPYGNCPGGVCPAPGMR